MMRWLLAAMLFLPGIAHADWYEASSRHFVVYSDQSPAGLRKFADRLERFDAAMRLLRGAKDEPVGKASRVTVYIVDDIGDVRKLHRSDRAAGFYIPRAGASLAVVPRVTGEGIDPQSILLHEYAHHLMWSLAPNTVYPAWYIEGSAETLATVRFYDDGSIDVGRPPQYRGRGLMQGNGLPIARLLTARGGELSNNEREALYGRGWLLSHYLMLSGQRKGQLEAYLDLLNQGKSSIDAASVFGDLRQLDRELERYKLSAFKVVRLNSAALAGGPIDLRKLTPGEAATMDVRIRSKVGVNAQTAPGVYERARKAAADYPDDPAAQLVLAEAAYDARDFAGAEAAAERSLKADPNRAEAHDYKAMARMAIAAQAKDRSPETWREIRRIIAAANHIDPDDPRPLVLYYRSFLQPGATPSDSAKAGLARAFQLAPQDTRIRFNLARMRLHDGDKVEARALLAPLAYQPHPSPMSAAAARIMAIIDRGDTAQAIDSLGEQRDDAE
jgi:tetratricopeptide (TPR) repeat protein